MRDESVARHIPWHSLVAITAKMVIRNSHLHVLISYVSIIMSKKLDLVLVSKPVVRDGDICRATCYVDQPILAFIQCVVIYPNL